MADGLAAGTDVEFRECLLLAPSLLTQEETARACPPGSSQSRKMRRMFGGNKPRRSILEKNTAGWQREDEAALGQRESLLLTR